LTRAGARAKKNVVQGEVEHISTAALRWDQVPESAPSLERTDVEELPPLWRFAATYVPPADFPNALELAAFVTEGAVTHWKETGEPPEIGLGGLRLTLWWLFQQWRHTADDGPWESTYPQYAGYARAAASKIRQELYGEAEWWWDPGHTPTDEERAERALERANETGALKELYSAAVDVLSEAIALRDAEADDPFDLPLVEADPVRAALAHAACLVARGLVASGGGRTLEEAQAVAYERAYMP
jgi:hypothetical protein